MDARLTAVARRCQVKLLQLPHNISNCVTKSGVSYLPGVFVLYGTGLINAALLAINSDLDDLLGRQRLIHWKRH